ncbi:hypothetical protein ACFOOP_16445 [Marinicaulis aureus]|uniref:Uncharacterized protein n=1 Tax=Hyphococcus aureus TaxID=2666033 RepID=A0ABW1KX25_9PROT
MILSSVIAHVSASLDGEPPGLLYGRRDVTGVTAPAGLLAKDAARKGEYP